MTSSEGADAGWLARTIELATANVAAGGGPFGAVVVRDGVVLAEGQNRVTRDNDPTAHAEVVAIRAGVRIPRRLLARGRDALHLVRAVPAVPRGGALGAHRSRRVRGGPG